MSAQLLTPFQMRSLTLPDRIVVSPMCQYMADNGSANDWHLMHLGQFSMGAGGLVITEATHVSAIGRITARCLGLYSDENEKTLKRVIDFCRRNGVAKLGIQLAHAGRKASTRTPFEGGKPLKADEGAWTTVAPSALPFGPDWHVPKALDANGLAEVKQQFVDSAKRALRIGFDLIELHGAHGYLLHQFLSPISNRRPDEYGGSLENRMRFPLQVFDAEVVVFARELKKRGCDFVDASSGQLDPRQQIPFAPGYNVVFADKIRKEAGIATMAVGLITKPAQAEGIISSGKADLIAIARAAMDDPRWAWHAARELGGEVPYAPNYVRASPAVWKP